MLRCQDFTPPTPLFRAALHDDTAQVKELLRSGSDPNESLFLGFRPVFFAVMHENLEMLRDMVESGADLKARDGRGSTTLMWAAYTESGKTELIEELLKLGVDPNASNQNGETALNWALKRGYAPVLAA